MDIGSSILYYLCTSNKISIIINLRFKGMFKELKYYLICFVSVIIVALLQAKYHFFPWSEEVSNCLQALGVFAALVVSIIALVYAKKEYKNHKKSAETTLICQYMHRYSTDKNIQAVQQYILDAALIDQKTGQIIGFNKDAKDINVPSVREKELFMHVFEELQLCIDAKMISQSTAIDLFGYYVSVFDQIEEYHSDITDYHNENYWKNYLKFANSVPKEFYLR